MRITVLLLALAIPVAAAEIQYSVTDLPDSVPGQDLWRYDYTLVGFTFLANQGFSIAFTPTLYLSLVTPPPGVPPAWDLLVLQPDAGIPSNGLYDALALSDNPPIGPLFAIEFVFAGPGIPGPQPYTLNQFDASGQLIGSLGSGQTIGPPGVSQIPEPASAALLVLGAAILAACRARYRRTDPPLGFSASSSADSAPLR